MSLHSDDKKTRCGVMRKRSIADVLWILFLTRISREVMALSLNTSLEPAHFPYRVMPFISKVLVEIEHLSRKHADNIPRILDTLTSRAAEEGFDDLDEHPSIGIELLVSAYPRVTEPSHTLPLSRLLMVCKSHPNGESRLDALIDNPSPAVEIEAPTRWFELLNSNLQEATIEDPVKPLVFELSRLAHERIKPHAEGTTRYKVLSKVGNWFLMIKGALSKTSQNQTIQLSTEITSHFSFCFISTSFANTCAPLH
ncbi:hypothetical protein BLNAU_17541 [Blattamonas nauphoetae]|uniref:Uncharacterized protein n=1 Tax=Blattamonas nauphoetae TaxID=2049346 RepID=A0ABQ9X6W7_9EUKA|nr:hypothetical protein BLNAU_17541 [Blattamonas nauphoetae]